MLNRRTNGAHRAGKRLFLSEVWIRLVELSHLPDGSPTKVAVAGVPKIQVRELLEPTRRVKARGQFVSERLNVDKAICTGRADRLLVETLSIELAAFDPGDLRADKRNAVLEILKAVHCPNVELIVAGF